MAGVQVQADELGDVLGAGPGGRPVGGGAFLGDAPVFQDQERSASTSASSGSWVTSRHGPVKSARWRLSSACTSRRVPASSADSGSSSSSSAGCPASARARATRCACPPDSWPGLRSARSVSPSRSSQWLAAALAARLPRPAGAGRERHVLGHGQVREQPVVLEHEADRPAGGLDERSGAGVVQDLPGQRDAAGRRSGSGRRAR